MMTRDFAFFMGMLIYQFCSNLSDAVAFASDVLPTQLFSLGDALDAASLGRSADDATLPGCQMSHDHTIEVGHLQEMSHRGIPFVGHRPRRAIGCFESSDMRSSQVSAGVHRAPKKKRFHITHAWAGMCQTTQHGFRSLGKIIVSLRTRTVHKPLCGQQGNVREVRKSLVLVHFGGLVLTSSLA
jgi:hypothetical protein